MSRITVELTPEQVDNIVIEELQAILAEYESDLSNAKIGAVTGVYSYNYKKETKQLRKTIKAIKRILKIYNIYNATVARTA